MSVSISLEVDTPCRIQFVNWVEMFALKEHRDLLSPRLQSRMRPWKPQMKRLSNLPENF